MSLFSTETRYVDSDYFESMLTFLEGFELPSGKIAQKIQYNSNFLSYRITDENKHLFVMMIPSEPGTVDFSKPKEVSADAYAYMRGEDRYIGWFVPSDVADKTDYFPILKQAFHENRDFKKREADYRYHFDDGESIVARYSPNPVQRLENTLHITAYEYLGGAFPQEWVLQTNCGQVLYLRERSGNVRLYKIEDFGRGDILFRAYIGGEHPGTPLRENEVRNIIDSVDYISFEDDVDDEVPESVLDFYEESYDVSQTYTTDL